MIPILSALELPSWLDKRDYSDCRLPSIWRFFSVGVAGNRAIAGIPKACFSVLVGKDWKYSNEIDRGERV